MYTYSHKRNRYTYSLKRNRYIYSHFTKKTSFRRKSEILKILKKFFEEHLSKKYTDLQIDILLILMGCQLVHVYFIPSR